MEAQLYCTCFWCGAVVLPKESHVVWDWYACTKCFREMERERYVDEKRLRKMREEDSD